MADTSIGYQGHLVPMDLPHLNSTLTVHSHHLTESAPRSKVPLSPGWNYGAECNQPWANPPKVCTEYDGQKAGAFDYSRAYPNMAGRTDVEGCCWYVSNDCQ